MNKYILNVKVEVSASQTLRFEVEGNTKEDAIANFENHDNVRHNMLHTVDVKYPSHVWEEIQKTQLSRWGDEGFCYTDVRLKITDVEESSSAVAEIRTKGGYVFHILLNGKVVDDVDVKKRNMTWPDIESFNKALKLFAQ
jgi:hypothetical protein